MALKAGRSRLYDVHDRETSRRLYGTWPAGVIAGPFVRERYGTCRRGRVSVANCETNWVRVELNRGSVWEGTGQDFAERYRTVRGAG